MRGAAATFCATEHVEHLLPREMIDVRGAEAGIIFEVLLREPPLGSSFEKKMFGIAVIMWKCFEGGSKFKKTRTTRLCIHQATLLACKAKLVPRTFARPRPTKVERGCHRASRTICMLFG